jgi:hypothetical protein
LAASSDTWLSNAQVLLFQLRYTPDCSLLAINQGCLAGQAGQVPSQPLRGTLPAREWCCQWEPTMVLLQGQRYREQQCGSQE